MKLYDSLGPNPHTTRLFALERGAKVDVVPMDLVALDHRWPPFSTEVNTKAEMPALIADDGTVVTEITAIMEYLDEVSDGPSLIGDTPEERANTRRWSRRAYLGIVHPATEWWRGTPDAENLYAGHRVLMPESQRNFRLMADRNLNLMERDIDGRAFIAGDRFSMADVMLFAFMDDAITTYGTGYATWVNTPARPNIASWYDRMCERPASITARDQLPAGPLVFT